MKKHLRALVLVAICILPLQMDAITVAELQAQLAVLKAQLVTLETKSPNNSTGLSTSCPNLSRNLYRGLEGPDVAELQKFLVSQNVLTADSVTGAYRSLTEKAVKQFQCSKMSICSGLANTVGYGVVGPKTRAFIASTCAVASTTSVSRKSGTSTASVAPAKSTATTTSKSPKFPKTPKSPTVTTSCTPRSAETQTLSCPSNQTGSITQTRASQCQAGATAPSWSDWSTTSNTCTTPAPVVAPIVLTKYPNFANMCERRVVDYQNGTNVLSSSPAGCTWPNRPFLFSITHESALNTHWQLTPDGTKIFDDNFVGDSATYMHDYRDTDLGTVFKHNFSPLPKESGTNSLGMALDTINFLGTNVTGRDYRDGHLFMGLNDLSVSSVPLSKNIFVNISFRIRGNDLQSYQGVTSSHRLILGTKLTWQETNRTNTVHFFEINLFKSPGFHDTQTQYSCPSDSLTYDYCFYDSSSAGQYAEGKYIPVSSISGNGKLSKISTDTWYTVRVPLSSLVKDAQWYSEPQTWSSATLDGLYLGIESKGASRLWVEVKDYSVTEE